MASSDPIPRPAPWLAHAPVPEDLRAWAATHESFAQAWAGCGRPDWLVAMGIAAGVDRALVVAVACDCIERACAGQGLPEAWAMAKRWTRGEVDGREAWAAGFRASAAARAARSPRERTVLQATAAAAFACDPEADDGYYAERAHAAEAVRLATLLSPTRRCELAAHVRRRIEGGRVLGGLEALARRATTPPAPFDPAEPGDLECAAPAVTARTLLRLRARRPG